MNPRLILVRSTTGDGGWSLHTQQQIEDAELHDEAPEVLLSGPAAWSNKKGDWDRPNREDYARAVQLAKQEKP